MNFVGVTVMSESDAPFEISAFGHQTENQSALRKNALEYPILTLRQRQIVDFVPAGNERLTIWGGKRGSRLERWCHAN